MKNKWNSNERMKKIIIRMKKIMKMKWKIINNEMKWMKRNNEDK